MEKKASLHTLLQKLYNLDGFKQENTHSDDVLRKDSVIESAHEVETLVNGSWTLEIKISHHHINAFE